MTPFFSILVPVYNHEKYVGLALDSLLAQTDADWEACVVDDGSTDGTPAIVDDYARRDSRIRVFHKSNGGEASALNAAWREARGTWINWLSSDDLYKSHKLAIQRDWINQHSACRYFFTDFQTLDDATGLMKPGYAAHTPARGQELVELLSSNYVNGIAMCVHREVFETVGAFDEVSRHGQDYDFHLRAIARYSPIRIPNITCIQRTHPGQLSQQRTQAMFYDCAASAIRFLNTVPPEAIMGSVNGRTFSEGALKLDEALSVAASPTSFVNLIGPHPAMVMRLVEWVAKAVNNNPVNRLYIDVMGKKARALAWTRNMEADAGLWQALSVMCDVSALPTSTGPIEVGDVIDSAWLWAKMRGDARAESLASYAHIRQYRELSELDIPSSVSHIPVLWIPLPNQMTQEDDHQAMRIASCFAKQSRLVVVMRPGSAAIRWVQGILTIQVPCVQRALISLAATPGDYLVLKLPKQHGWWLRLGLRVLDVRSEADLQCMKYPDGTNKGGAGVRLSRRVVRWLGQGLRLRRRGYLAFVRTGELTVKRMNSNV